MDALHIVCFDVPYPADYGGAIDVFYRIRTLHRLGVRIILHCYVYGDRQPAPALAAYCTAVHYYPRQTGPLNHLATLPYIVRSRRSRALLDRLCADDYPILLEGLHTAGVLLRGQLANRRVVLRSHNIEHHYYSHLAEEAATLWRRLYFRKEAAQLRRLLHRLPTGLSVGAISSTDEAYLRRRFPGTFWLPPFHSNRELRCRPGRGDFVLYHGNLAVPENERVALELVETFSGGTVSLVLAGKSPGARLRRAVAGSRNVRLHANPAGELMDELIQSAHVILLLTYQPTGIKLKLLESLYRGRFCLANATMLSGTGLAGAVIQLRGETYPAVAALMARDFTPAMIEHRAELLRPRYDNERNGRELLRRLFP